MKVLRLSRVVVSAIVPCFFFALIFAFQLKLGHEYALFPLYFFPIAKLTWEYGARLGYLIALFAASLWILAVINGPTEYSRSWLPYYNGAIRALIFLGAAHAIVIFRRVVEQHRKRMEAMRSMLNVCHGCGAVQGSNGQWIDFEEFGKFSSNKICECPRCSRSAGENIKQS